MPTYRVYYAEREAAEADKSVYGVLRGRFGHLGQRQNDAYNETEWEEEVDAADVGGALDAFFKEHVRDNAELICVDEAGESHPVEGLSYDPEKTYIWIEGGKMMEYQGLDETTLGMVTCPLCVVDAIGWQRSTPPSPARSRGAGSASFPTLRRRSRPPPSCGPARGDCCGRGSGGKVSSTAA